MTASVAASALLAVLAASTWTGSLAFASTAAAPSVTAAGYTPHQLETAYGVLPLFEHGIDGRRETVVLPELAEPQFPLPTSDIRRDLAQFDKLFHLPAARVRSSKRLPPRHRPGSRTEKRCWMPRWCTPSPPVPPSSNC
jgi:subtilase family serine protease